MQKERGPKRSRLDSASWLMLLEVQASSGLSIKEFYAVQGISVASFYQWRRRLQAAKVADEGLFSKILVEEKARNLGLDAEQRLELRLKESKPVFDTLGDWLHIQYDKVTPASANLSASKATQPTAKPSSTT